MAAPSEQISAKWIEGTERVCVDCALEITNLAKQVGQVHSRFLGGKEVERWIRCMDCRPGMKEWRARREVRS